MQSDLNPNAKGDGLKLERIMLIKDEWELLNNLIDILEGFEEVIALLSGAKYVTISLMYPAIFWIITEIKPVNEPSLTITGIEEDLEEVDQMTVFENIEKIIGDSKDSIEVIENKEKKNLDISKPLNTNGCLNKVKNVMYNSMAEYWKTSATVAMVACTLDPQFKKLWFTTEIIKKQIYDELCYNFNEEKEANKAVNINFFF